MLRAAADTENPYLLLLDEMNLAHVERYFADVLSGMESGSSILPNLRRAAGEWRIQEPARVAFPPNLFVAGTVNIDETTYMFSPKVLDRANTLEFRVTTADLQPGATPPSQVDPGEASLVRRFIYDSTMVAEDDWEGRSQLADWLRALHGLLSSYDREFGHRVFFESLRFGSLLREAGEEDLRAALDLQVMQKILPRFHGSIRQVADALYALGDWCFQGPDHSASASFDPVAVKAEDAVLPLSFEKVQRMTRRLRADHFVGFAE
jgi:5-methylcytosine-specific restriction protein B